jgi:excisionase family DNA binding protein
MGKKKDIDVSELIERRIVGVEAACYALGCGKDKLYELLSAGEIESYLDGKSRKIVVASIDRYIARQLEASRQFERYHRPVRRAEHQHELETT